MEQPVTFRWMGVASLAITCAGQTLAVDPFFTRPPFRQFLFGRPAPNAVLAAQYLPACDYVLVSHTHWDHVMDVPAVAAHTGAVAFGSPNTCRVLELAGLPAAQIRQVAAGDGLDLGPFQVAILEGRHGYAPFLGRPGPLAPHLRLPLRLRDYRMDSYFGFLVEVGGYRLLIEPTGAAPADIMFLVPTLRGPAHYAHLLQQVHPAVVVLIHWDNLFVPLSQPIREYFRPDELNTEQMRRYVAQFAPRTQFLKPEPFCEYALTALLAVHRPP